MRLYLTSTGEWTGNQSDAAGLVRANGGTWEQVDVPTDKPGLIAWLTDQWARFAIVPAPSVPTPTTDTDAQRAENLRRISIEEEIQSCDLPRLAVLAENVAWRFHELARASKHDHAR